MYKLMVPFSMAIAGVMLGMGVPQAYTGSPIAAAGMLVGAGLFGIAAAVFSLNRT
ncbi:TPA: hypothetical protein SL557_000320 [Pseudomonas aeruginosa]|nr:hypothetical protein [Pseudomonas aeruginosa]